MILGTHGFVSNITFYPAKPEQNGEKGKQACANCFFRFDGNAYPLVAFGRNAEKLDRIRAKLETANLASPKPSTMIYVEGRLETEPVQHRGRRQEVTSVYAHKVLPVIVGEAAFELMEDAAQIYARRRNQRQRPTHQNGSGQYARPATQASSPPPPQHSYNGAPQPAPADDDIPF